MLHCGASSRMKELKELLELVMIVKVYTKPCVARLRTPVYR